MENIQYWSLDCDIMKGSESAGVKIATATSLNTARAIVRCLNSYERTRQNAIESLTEAADHLVKDGELVKLKNGNYLAIDKMTKDDWDRYFDDKNEHK